MGCAPELSPGVHGQHCSASASAGQHGEQQHLPGLPKQRKKDEIPAECVQFASNLRRICAQFVPRGPRSALDVREEQLQPAAAALAALQRSDQAAVDLAEVGGKRGGNRGESRGSSQQSLA